MLIFIGLLRHLYHSWLLRNMHQFHYKITTQVRDKPNNQVLPHSKRKIAGLQMSVPDISLGLGSTLEEQKRSATGTRTQVSCVKGKYDNHLHHSGLLHLHKKLEYKILMHSYSQFGIIVLSILAMVTL